MAETVNVQEAESNLPKLLERVESGEEIVIHGSGKLGVRLIPEHSVVQGEPVPDNALGIFDGLYEVGYLDQLRSEEHA